jgi:hypothetical protein
MTRWVTFCKKVPLENPPLSDGKQFPKNQLNFLLSEEFGKDRTIGLRDGGKHFGQFSGLKENRYGFHKFSLNNYRLILMNSKISANGWATSSPQSKKLFECRRLHYNKPSRATQRLLQVPKSLTISRILPATARVFLGPMAWHRQPT